MVLSVAAKDTAVLTYRIRSLRRGYYQLGPLTLQTGDLFGFVPEQQITVPSSYLTVYPRLSSLNQLGLPSRLPFGTIASHQRLFDDPARPMGVREYQSGDSPRQINWKVSAHTRQLMVKTYQPAILLETAVVLNLNREDYETTLQSSAIEWGIEIAASLAAHLVEQRQAVGLVTTGRDLLLESMQDGQPELFDELSGRLVAHREGESGAQLGAIPPHHGRVHLMKLLEHLARLEPTRGAQPFATWLPTAVSSLTWGTTLLIITPSADPATYHSLHQLVRRGLNPVLLATQTQSDWPQRQAQARQLGFTAYQTVAPRDLAALSNKRR